MALLNIKKKEINAKIVYYGPGLSGKTTNIQFIHTKLKPGHRGKLMTLATQTDRTLFFDFLPVELGEIRGMKTRFQIYTVPGQVFYNATRKLVLKNVDGVVFVADSQKKMLDDNIESYKNLKENLKHYNKTIEDVPIVFQFNKSDLDDLTPIEELNEAINEIDAPFFQAVASDGKGVLQTLTTISKVVLHKLKDSTEFAKIQQHASESDVDSKTAPAKPAKKEAPVAVEPELDIEEPELDVEEPELDIEEPEIEVEEPELDVDEPELDVEMEIEEPVELDDEEEDLLDGLEMPEPEPAEEVAIEEPMEIDDDFDDDIEVDIDEDVKIGEEPVAVAVAAPAAKSGPKAAIDEMGDTGFQIIKVQEPERLVDGSFKLSMILRNNLTEEEVALGLVISLESLIG